MEGKDIDIINIDLEIKNKFEKEFEQISGYKKNINRLKSLLNDKELSSSYKNLIVSSIKTIKNKISLIENKLEYNNYIFDTVQYIERYNEILNTPVKISFMKTQKVNNTELSIEKKDMIEKYIKVAQKYHNISKYIPDISNNNIVEKCEHCEGDEFEILENDTRVCLNCSIEQNTPLYTSSYKDINRVNISTKYTYDRSVHFRDCMDQYQGKENRHIKPQVYIDLMKEFEKCNLLKGTQNDSMHYRCKNITKKNILMSLKDLSHLGYNKYYENVVLIHYTMTGIKPDNISHLENILKEEFKILTNLYDELYRDNENIERKSFIGAYYVLYKLLCKHKHPCKEEDFNILKTHDRQTCHDEICGTLFEKLGWNFESSLG